MAVDPQPTAVTNEYLALRKAKIARNEQRLRDLGLLRQDVHDDNVHRGSDSHSDRPPLPLPLASTVSRTHQRALPLRRSPRLERSRQMQMQMQIPNENEQQRKRKQQSGVASVVSAKSQSETNKNVMTAEKATATLFNNDTTVSPKRNDNRHHNDTLTLTQSNSARSIRLNVETLISRCLGVPLSSTGKAFVMKTSVELAACPPPLHHTTSISFNKYSGIQEWANNVVFLWVNLHAPRNEVRNDFTYHGRQVAFYGGSRMHDHTPVIQKLKLLGVHAAAAANELDSADGIVLWCRSYETHRKAFGPYVCLGRLSLVSYDPSSQPLMFVFQLQDYDTLVGDSRTRAVFANLTGLPL